MAKKQPVRHGSRPEYRIANQYPGHNRRNDSNINARKCHLGITGRNDIQKGRKDDVRSKLGPLIRTTIANTGNNGGKSYNNGNDND